MPFAEQLPHLATAFAVRKGIVYRRNADYRALGRGNPFQRWGADITVRQGGRELRLLSVHLISGCWGARQDTSGKRRRICITLRDQFGHLKSPVGACHATDRASRVATAPLFHACRRHYPGRAGRCARRSLPGRWPPPRYSAGRPPRCPFRRLLDVHSRCSPHGRQAARDGPLHRSASVEVVTSFNRSDYYRPGR